MMNNTCNGAGELPAFRPRASAAYKRRILHEADSCSTPSEVGALLRREGLYMSYLTYWQRQRASGALDLSERREVEVADVRRRLARTEAELEHARKVIATQGQLSTAMGHLLELTRARSS
jgi:hypothetical protein